MVSLYRRFVCWYNLLRKKCFTAWITYILNIYIRIYVIYITINIIIIYYIVLVLYYINLICFKKCKTVVFASLTSADSRKIRKSDPTGGNAFESQKGREVFCQKRGVNL